MEMAKKKRVKEWMLCSGFRIWGLPTSHHKQNNGDIHLLIIPFLCYYLSNKNLYKVKLSSVKFYNRAAKIKIVGQMKNKIRLIHPYIHT